MESRGEKPFGATYTNRQLFGGFWRLAKPFWFSEERWKARGVLLLIVALTLFSVFLTVQFNAWYQTTWNDLQKFDLKGFGEQMVKFCLLALFWVVSGVFNQFLTQQLQNHWRLWMTRRFLEQWMSEKSHYLWQLTEKKTDNPDQRISEDIRDFVSNSLTLSLGLLNQVVTFFSFITILWTLSGPLVLHLGGRAFSVPGYMAWACLLYSIVGTWLTHRIGRPLIDLNFRQQLLEANFRFGLVRLRENGESVALSGGEPTEERDLKGHFQWVFSNFRSIIFKQLHLNMFTTGFGQLALIFPLAVASPQYFAKKIGIGGLQRVMDAFGQVQGALSWVVNNYVTLAYWRSVVERLEGFENEVVHTKRMHAEAQAVLRESASAPSVLLEGVELSLPGQPKPLTAPLTMEFKKGQSVLISGPSGCGKSTLLRALYGLWPFTRGRVSLPGREGVMVLPQKPYLPVGSLKAAFTYPRAEDEIPDSEVLRVLPLCRLEHLKDRLPESENWALMLSVGEQQRVAWARVFLQKPQWLFLDEATSALDEDAQDRLYHALKEQLPETTMVSVAHTQDPRAHHQAVWDFLSGPGLEPTGTV